MDRNRMVSRKLRKPGISGNNCVCRHAFERNIFTSTQLCSACISDYGVVCGRCSSFLVKTKHAEMRAVSSNRLRCRGCRMARENCGPCERRGGGRIDKLEKSGACRAVRWHSAQIVEDVALTKEGFAAHDPVDTGREQQRCGREHEQWRNAFGRRLAGCNQ